MKELVKRISKNVLSIRSSSNVERFYFEASQTTSLPQNRLLRDNDTRWNSNYVMVSRVLTQWIAFDVTWIKKQV